MVLILIANGYGKHPAGLSRFLAVIARPCCSGRRGQLLEDASREEAYWTTTAHLNTLIPNSAVIKIGSRLAAGTCESRRDLSHVLLQKYLGSSLAEIISMMGPIF
ncbi:hypothetical protein llap_7430 [Limosa lapponica baueri]|uniref:Uncharacterized protein n=1 Tax=Limosa lapponica baueri TaxID=1758121 RepID=A0A2I0U881_LIMLA|nr:hypothetical protein llap_7430 [Limosa lapponica baueri]